MNLFKNVKGLLAAGVLAFGTLPAHASIITLDSGWQSFSFDDVGSAWSQTFEFTLTDTAWFSVTDAYLSGDQFEFFVNGAYIGVTSAPTSQGDQISNNFDGAFADSRWSSAEIMLTAGSYVVSGSTVLSPYGSGGAAVQLSSQSMGGPVFTDPTRVSEPGTAAMLFLAVAGLFLRNRKHAAR
ncbi:PEP-CTERM sorting domain-containing protein [Aestuariibacter halophilus]|uniref:PEP-CTERM sorting domain-containing protein n=1 Tax=Fluctibacter halophilus TaxID=226011 RepID=A0ABS8G7M1_9ALTE|nr:PEP-CTERM sorting domain-containing protein [Aestuariibacter halophilus]MCC2616071.1 PEP-CTERM sorting domain-containing protein [Aestuariibacter halophilus]